MLNQISHPSSPATCFTWKLPERLPDGQGSRSQLMFLPPVHQQYKSEGEYLRTERFYLVIVANSHLLGLFSLNFCRPLLKPAQWVAIAASILWSLPHPVSKQCGTFFFKTGGAKSKHCQISKHHIDQFRDPFKPDLSLCAGLSCGGNTVSSNDCTNRGADR